MTGQRPYLLIESQGNWSGPNADRFLRDALALAEAGHQVWVFLVQDGVLAAAADASPTLAKLAAAGARVYADDFSASQRALTAGRLSDHVTLAGMADIARILLRDDVRAVWH